MKIDYDIPIIGQSAEVTINTPDIPFPKFKTMLIAANKTHAEQLRASYADPQFMAEREITNIAHGNPKVFVTYPGEILAGVRFSNIAIQSRVLAEIEKSPKAWDWYSEIAVCRLVEGGKIAVQP